MRVRKSVSMTVIMLFLMSLFVAISCNASAKNHFVEKHLLEFNPIPQMEAVHYDDYIMPAGNPVNIPIKVKYMVSVPSIFNILPVFLKNILIYGNVSVPPVRIHLSMVKIPDWLDFTISCPDIYINIKENEFSCANTSIFIAAYSDAPAYPSTVVIRAEAQPVGRISNQSVEISLIVHPTYLPLLHIEADQTLKYATSNDRVRFLINITNRANKESVIRIGIDELPRDWSASLSNSTIVLPMDGCTTVSLDVYTSADFRKGDIGEIHLNFTVLPYPPPPDGEATPANTYHLTLFVVNPAIVDPIKG